MAGRKIFVGSLPMHIEEQTLRAEFSRYGIIEEVFIKGNCEPGRQWAFITYADTTQAQLAKEQTDRILVIPGGERPVDVLIAKNQGMFGQNSDPSGLPQQQGYPVDQAGYAASQARATKIFVGSLPDGIMDDAVRSEFCKYGSVIDMHLKENCAPGRQWAFITFASTEEAQHAVQACNGILFFPGSIRACEVTMARNQGMFGQDAISAGPPRAGQPMFAPVAQEGPKKIFVGSMPDGITEQAIRAEFNKYGAITDIFLKVGCEAGRQWGFVTFATADEAVFAKQSCDRVLYFPGSEMPVEVTLARNQGMFGQGQMHGGGQGMAAPGPISAFQPAYQQPPAYQVQAESTAPRKVFVGSLPEGVSEGMLRAEFARYGQITDVFLKMAADGRHWAFITYTRPDQAQQAKEATDRILMLPGSVKPVEVMLARNQGRFGQEPMGGGRAPGAIPHSAPFPGGPAHHAPQVPMGSAAGQPPPPSGPPPAHLTQWRMYKTAAGLPYYHNHKTQKTQWECPPDLQVPGAASKYRPY